jgi:ABC-2 type transport system permease protein
LPIYAMWALPTVGWLMLCSAWAKSKPFLWAVVIPVALGIVLGWFHLLGITALKTDWYWSKILARLLFSVFPGGWFKEAGVEQLNHNPQAIDDFLTLSHAYSVLGKPDIWIGAIAGIAMLALAIWFRRWRDDS